MIKEDATCAVFRNKRLAQQIDPAQCGGTIALELAHHGTGVQVVTTRQSQNFGKYTEVNAVVRVAVDHGMHGAVNVQQHAIFATPVGQTRIGTEATSDVVVHDDGCADFFGVLSALVHLFRCRRGHIEVVAFTLSGFVFGLKGGLLHEIETLAPTHEGLAVDVLVILGEVKTTAQTFVHCSAVVLCRQTKLRFDGAAQQWTTIFVHDVTLDLDAQGRTTAGLDVGDRKTHIFQTQGANGFETKNVANQGSKDVDDGTFLKQIDGVGNESVKTGIVARYVFDTVRTALVIIQVGQQIGPHRGPSSCRRLSSDGCGGFFAVNTRLGRDLETGQDIGVQGCVVRHPVGLTVFLYPCVIGFCCHT